MKLFVYKHIVQMFRFLIVRPFLIGSGAVRTFAAAAAMAFWRSFFLLRPFGSLILSIRRVSDEIT